MTKFGLNGFLERTKGASLRYKLRELWWQLRYAWQRAWRGYDFTDVFELGYNFTAKMPVLLAEFLKNNVGLFYDAEADMYNVGSMMPWMDYTPRTLDEILRLEAVYKNEAAEPPAAQ